MRTAPGVIGRATLLQDFLAAGGGACSTIGRGSLRAAHFMSLVDRTTLRVLFTVLATGSVLGFVWLARKPLLAFLFAMLFAYLLEPLIGLVQKWTRCRRGIAIAVVYVLILAVLSIVGLVVGPRVVQEGRHLSQAAPELYNKIASGRIAFQVGKTHGWSEETQADLQRFIVEHRGQVLSTITAQGATITEVAGNALWIVLIPILAVFFLKEKSRFARNIENLLDNPRSRQLLTEILSDLDEMLSQFVRAQLYVVALSLTAYVSVLTLMNVPYSWALGTIGGLLEFIPFVGPLVTGILIVGVSFALNYNHVLLVLLFLMVWRVMEDYVISPHIFGGRVEVHPLATIFGVLAGGEIAGVVGIYFAVPVMAAIRILWRHWRRHTASDKFGQESATNLIDQP